MTHRAKGKSASKSKKPHWKTIKGIGRRCVLVLSSGKWVFKKDSACGGK